MKNKYPGLYKRKGSDNWQYKYTLNGNTERVSTGLQNKEYAWLATEKYREMVRNAKLYGSFAWEVFKNEYFTVGCAADAKQYRYSKEWSIKEFERVFPIKYTLELNPDNLQTAVDKWAMEKELSENTIDAHALKLKLIAKWAARRKYIPFYDWSVVKRISKKTHRDEKFTVPEVLAILNKEKSNQLNYRFLFCMFWFNMRRGEVVHFRWDWLDTATREIEVKKDGAWTPKCESDGRLKHIPVHKQGWDTLLKWRAQDRKAGIVSDYVVVDENSWRPDYEYYWSVKMYNLSKKYAPKHLYCHKFRHSSITGMDSVGVAPSQIQQASRHRDYRTTEGYIHPDTGPARIAFQALADKFWPKKRAHKRAHARR